MDESKSDLEALGCFLDAPCDVGGYDASSIRILSPDEAVELFPFERAGEWAKRYPHVAPKAIERLVSACTQSGWDYGLAERRYLRGDKSVVPPQGFYDVYLEEIGGRRGR